MIGVADLTAQATTTTYLVLDSIGVLVIVQFGSFLLFYSLKPPDNALPPMSPSLSLIAVGLGILHLYRDRKNILAGGCDIQHCNAHLYSLSLSLLSLSLSLSHTHFFFSLHAHSTVRQCTGKI